MPARSLLRSACVAALAFALVIPRLAGAAVPPRQSLFTPHLSVTLVPGKSHLALSWTTAASACGYEVHRSNAPYFAPSDSTLQATLPAGTAAYTDYLAGANPALNYMYSVRATDCATGAWSDSNRAGAFSFSLFGAATSTPAYRARGLNYGPYIDPDEDPERGGDQITDEELADRMALIAPYTEWVRTFGCNADLREAGRFAHTAGLKAAIGAWLGPEDSAAGQEQNRAQIDCLEQLISAGEVDIAIVGSEVLRRGNLSEAELVAYIDEVRQYVADRGLSIPVTTADTYGVWNDHPSLVDAVDLLFANYYPYWEGRKVETAMYYLNTAHQQLIGKAKGKEVIVSETGWPDEGNTIGDAVPSRDNASYYFLDFVSWARALGVDYFYFESYDEQWKWNVDRPQEAHFGLWTADGALKPGMQRVFDGETMADNWTDLPQAIPFIHFRSLPDVTLTNLPDFVVASFTVPTNEVRLNGSPIPAGSKDAYGNFAFTVPLAPGDNTLVLTVFAGSKQVLRSEKRVVYDPDYSTATARLLYVHSVSAGSGVPALPGTVVIDLDHDTLLGLIKDKYAVGISAAGDEIYMTDRSALSSASHTWLRTLPFAASIPGNGFLASADGTRLYSQNQRLDRASNALLANLPVSIETGTSWGYWARGGPAISADGKRIYCCAPVKVIDTEANTVASTSLTTDILSDIAVSPDDRRLLVTDYGNRIGRVQIADALTLEKLGQVSNLGDYAGEIAFSPGSDRAVIGSAGNPYEGGGRVNVVDVNTFAILSQTYVPLADNVATSGGGQFYVSAGKNELYPRYGVDAYDLEAAGNLARTRTFYLGINRWQQSSQSGGLYDQIRRILYKPAGAANAGK